MSLAATAGSFGPTPAAAQVTVIVFAAALLADAVVGGRTVWSATRADRGTYWLIQLAQIAAVALALLARWIAPWADLPTWVWALGIVTMTAGAVIRVWALRVLGVQFRRDINVDTDQPVVSDGPYRWVRHPSYTGALLIFAGLGLALANVLSLLALTLIPGLAYLRRIRVEEAELGAVLGERYDQYARGRARLLPSVW